MGPSKGHLSKGQLCERARQWASLRLDGELSELENALLDAHLGRCQACSGFVREAESIAAALGSVLGVANHSARPAKSALRHTAMVAMAESPDTLRALRRPALVSRRHQDFIPRNRRMDGIV